MDFKIIPYDILRYEILSYFDIKKTEKIINKIIKDNNIPCNKILNIDFFINYILCKLEYKYDNNYNKVKCRTYNIIYKNKEIIFYPQYTNIYTILNQ